MVHAAPVLRGGLVARAAWLVTGLFLFAAGIVCFLESKLGLSPWDVLHQGIAKHTPLSFGVANEVVALAVLFLAWALGSPPGFGTVANAVLIGGFIALVEPLGPVRSLGGDPLAVRAGLLAAGMVLFGVGTALYMGAAFGAGPRDSLMLVVSRRGGVRVGVVRTAIESAVTVVGFLLGGKVGIGTLAFAFGIGPAIESSFWLLRRSPASLPSTPSTIEPA